MLFLAPMNNREEIKNIFSQKNISFNEFSGCVTAKNGDEVLGFCLYDLDTKKITVHYIEPLDDVALADGILRSTLHVAAERSVMNAFYSDTVPENFLNMIGFIKNTDDKSLDIDKLFGGCQSCGK